jgi:hypothetical protein
VVVAALLGAQVVLLSVVQVEVTLLVQQQALQTVVLVVAVVETAMLVAQVQMELFM